MRPRPIPQLLVLTLLFALAACVPGLDSASGFGLPFFRFTSPDPGSLELEPSVDFRLLLPTTNGSLKLRVTLDGQPVDPATFRVGARDVRGTLEALAPGPHRLEASLRVAVLSFSLPLHAWIAFEMAAPRELLGARERRAAPRDARGAGRRARAARRGGDTSSTAASPTTRAALIFRELEPGDGYRVVTTGAPREASRALHVCRGRGQHAAPSPSTTARCSSPATATSPRATARSSRCSCRCPGPPRRRPVSDARQLLGLRPVAAGRRARTRRHRPLRLLRRRSRSLCDAPSAPEALIAGVLGFATVGVNMRGTGCSGGAYDFFEPLQLLDGYDIIETVAAQPWAYKVGMVGISFPGICQLFVASTQPPSLAAITPLAVISRRRHHDEPGRHPQRRLRDRVGHAGARQADPYGHGWEQEQRRRRRHRLRGEPAPALAEGRHHPEGVRPPVLRAGRSTTR